MRTQRRTAGSLLVWYVALAVATGAQVPPCSDGSDGVRFGAGVVGCDGGWTTAGVAGGAVLCGAGWSMCDKAALLGSGMTLDECACLSAQPAPDTPAFYAAAFSAMDCSGNHGEADDIAGCGCNLNSVPPPIWQRQHHPALPGTDCYNVAYALGQGNWMAGGWQDYELTGLLELTTMRHTSGSGGVLCCEEDECAAGAHNCDATAVCVNTAGSFACRQLPVLVDCSEGRCPTSQIATKHGGIADRAFDGNGYDGLWTSSGCTHTGGGDHPKWWRVDLGALRSLSHLKVWNRQDCCAGRLKGFRISVGEEDVQADASVCFEHTGGDAPPAVTEAPCEGTARYIWIDNPAKPLTLCEVEIYACNPGYSSAGAICLDDDECALGSHNCDANAVCVNSEGSFSCACNSGYSGDGSTCCGTNALVTDMNRTTTCSCAVGFAMSSAGHCFDGYEGLVELAWAGSLRCSGVPQGLANAVDGDDSTCVRVDAGSDARPWWRVDLGGHRQIVSISSTHELREDLVAHPYAPRAHAYAFQVLVSSTDSLDGAAACFQGSSIHAGLHACEATGRYVWVVFGSSSNGLCELGVWAVPPAPAAWYLPSPPVTPLGCAVGACFNASVGRHSLSPFALDGEASISLWFRGDGAQAAGATLIDVVGAEAGKETLLRIQCATASQDTCTFTYGPRAVEVTYPSFADPDQWVHVQWTLSRSEWRIRCNGVLIRSDFLEVGEREGPGGLFASSAIGARLDESQGFSGLIADVRVFDAAIVLDVGSSRCTAADGCYDPVHCARGDGPAQCRCPPGMGGDGVGPGGCFAASWRKCATIEWNSDYGTCACTGWARIGLARNDNGPFSEPVWVDGPLVLCTPDSFPSVTSHHSWWGACFCLDVPLAATCVDGAQNGDELGVDCGGSCPSCTEAERAPCAAGWTPIADSCYKAMRSERRTARVSRAAAQELCAAEDGARLPIFSSQEESDEVWGGFGEAWLGLRRSSALFQGQIDAWAWDDGAALRQGRAEVLLGEEVAVDNGGMEADTLADPPQGWEERPLAGWVCGGHTYLVAQGTTLFGGLQSGDGGQFAALRSLDGAGASLKQEVSGLTAGARYALAFRAANRPRFGQAPILRVLVEDSAGSAMASEFLVGDQQDVRRYGGKAYGTLPSSGFAKVVVVFTATATMATLHLHTMDATSGDRMVLIDAVSVAVVTGVPGAFTPIAGVTFAVGDGECATVSGHGAWDARECSAATALAVCQLPRTPQPCGVDEVLVNGRCLWAHVAGQDDRELDHAEAEAACMSWGGHLLTAKDAADFVDLRKLPLSSAHVGMYKEDPHHPWAWRSGHWFTYLYLRQLQQQQFVVQLDDNRLCGEVSPGTKNYQPGGLRMETVSCDEAKSEWVCEKPHAKTLPPFAPPKDSCSDLGGHAQDGWCYWRAIWQFLPYHDAERACRRWGGHLATPSSFASSSVSLPELYNSGGVWTLYESAIAGGDWLGLESFGADHLFRHADSSPVDLAGSLPYRLSRQRFLTGAGDDAADRGPRCATMSSDWRMDARECDLVSVPHFTCKRPVDPSKPPARVPAPCHAEAHGKCWFVITAPLHFAAAAAGCSEWGGALAAVHTAGEDRAVDALQRSFGLNQRAWIGLQVGAREWAWLDGSSLGFSNWALPNLVANGGFELGAFVRMNECGAVPKWEVAGHVCLVGNGVKLWPQQSGDELAYLALKDTGSSARQEVGPLVPGELYTLSFRHAAKSGSGTPQLRASVLDTSPNPPLQLTAASLTASGATFLEHALVFVASSSEATVVFENEGGRPVVVDWVQVTPDPSTVSLPLGKGDCVVDGWASKGWEAENCNSVVAAAVCNKPLSACGQPSGWCQAELASQGRLSARVVHDSCCGCCFFVDGPAAALQRLGACAAPCTEVVIADASFSLPEGGAGLFSDLEDLRVLALHAGSQLSVVKSAMVAGIQSLEVLRLSHNAIAAVPTGFLEHLPRLRELDLSYNAIAELPPSLLQGTPALKFLDLSENRLEALPEGMVTGTPLVYMSLARNRLRQLEPLTFGAVPTLETLRLSANRISAVEPLALAGMPQLRKLELNANELTIVKREALSGLHRLKILLLQRNQLAEIEMGAFDGLDALEILELWENELRRLPVGTMLSFSKLSLVSLWKNPLECQPKLRHTQGSDLTQWQRNNLPECIPVGCERRLQDRIGFGNPAVNDYGLGADMHALAVTTVMQLLRADVRVQLDVANLEANVYIGYENGVRCWCVGAPACFVVGGASAEIDLPSYYGSVGWWSTYHDAFTGSAFGSADAQAETERDARLVTAAEVDAPRGRGARWQGAVSAASVVAAVAALAVGMAVRARARRGAAFEETEAGRQRSMAVKAQLGHVPEGTELVAIQQTKEWMHEGEVRATIGFERIGCQQPHLSTRQLHVVDRRISLESEYASEEALVPLDSLNQSDSLASLTENPFQSGKRGRGARAAKQQKGQ